MRYVSIANEIKSPLRYPGGKTRAVKKIFRLIPDFNEYRELFVGGGSIFIALKQRTNLNKHFLLNDLNSDLIYFWQTLRDNPDNLISSIYDFKNTCKNFNECINKLQHFECHTPMELATRFFIRNRTSFSGLTDSGGFSKEAYERRFTNSSIERLKPIAALLRNVEITNSPYEHLLYLKGDHTFIFLDPPYFKAKKKKLYGHHGNLHSNFDHELFAKHMRDCPHPFLITYDDCPEIRKYFNWAPHVSNWTLQYGINNVGGNPAKKGKELFITNYNPKQLRLL